MKTVGLYLIRNEVDLIEINLLHHFATAIDAAIVVDNGSSDGTLERVAALANFLPIQLISEPGAYDQSARTTAIARAAYDDGADWLLPIDADEFWLGIDEPLRSVMAATPEDVTTLQAEIVNFVQAREVLAADPSSLVTMTMRPAQQVGPIEACEELVESESIGFVEIMYPPKGVRRAQPNLVILPGNHSAIGVPNEKASTGQVVCLHAPLRARSLLTGKLDQGRRVLEENPDRQDCWHVRRWWRLAREGTIDTEWAANSHEHGSLDVAGQSRPLILDTRLRDAVVAFVPDVAPIVRPAGAAVDPSIAAFQLAMTSVPGRLSQLDVATCEMVSNLQREYGVEGNLLTVGLTSVQSAVLMGYLAVPDIERTIVCGELDHPEPVDDTGVEPNLTEPTHLDEDLLFRQYERFHARPPLLAHGPSTDLPGASCRLVQLPIHGDDERVLDELLEAKRLLVSDGIVVFDGTWMSDGASRDPRRWEAIVGDHFASIVMTERYAYGTVGRGTIPWKEEIDRALATAAGPTTRPPGWSEPEALLPTPTAPGLRSRLRQLPGATWRAARGRPNGVDRPE